MIKKILKTIGYTLLFVLGIGILGNVTKSLEREPKTDKVLIDITQLEKRPISVTEFTAYKGRIYSKEHWVLLTFKLSNGNMFLGSDSSKVATYIGTDKDGYDVYKDYNDLLETKINNIDVSYKTSSTFYFNPNTNDVKWKSLDSKGKLKEYTGKLNRIF